MQSWTVVWPKSQAFNAPSCNGLASGTEARAKHCAAQIMQCNWADLERRGWRTFRME